MLIGDYLRQELRNRATPDDRTVINFTWSPRNSDREYEYVGIWVEDRDMWFLSGNFDGLTVISHESLMAALAKPEVIAARTAIAWDLVKGLGGAIPEEPYLMDQSGSPICTHGYEEAEEPTPEEAEEPTPEEAGATLNRLIREALWGSNDDN